MQLQDKVAVITGGADGIGAGLTRAFVQEGAKVLFVDVQEDKGLALEKELGSAAKFLKKDLRSPGMEQRIQEAAREAFGVTLDVLVNNAQASKPQLLLDVDQPALDLAFETGLWATWKLMRIFYNQLAASKGSIINFASGAGILGMPTQGVYGMNKEAIRGLSRTAANEWGPVGIRVNVVAPAAATAGFQWWQETYPDQAKEMISKVPLQRVGDVLTDVAPIVVFLASSASQYMTGQTLMADGGSIQLR
ncbi:SDR family NAD(P)-dependent oxidoreductase [Hymenobacter monticola]|uniref:SDR family oxidoreductase n=1 Tax=Hymenobacter monticola TaxID=1705399 RepID=A0ABY4BCB5_9BACT|nr:SDR family oxidoreductase [Hymenobacter monticola]UOE36419.1 SDR family oxidoreductase [Hymenobacter monticola]